MRTLIFFRRQAWHDGKRLSPSSIVVYHFTVSRASNEAQARAGNKSRGES
jgi:hypothetical protein